MNVGFTGTSKGLTTVQSIVLYDYMASLDGERVTGHHGDCIGADAQFHVHACNLGWKLHIHPPLDPKARAFKTDGVVHEPAPYLVRDRIIVGMADRLIACPDTEDERRRSGTWATVRYARIASIPITYIGPKGLFTPGAS